MSIGGASPRWVMRIRAETAACPRPTHRMDGGSQGFSASNGLIQDRGNAADGGKTADFVQRVRIFDAGPGAAPDASR